MDVHIALYDACVLYPAPLRDLLMHLALTDLFRAKWSHQIHEEWITNVLLNRPDLTKSQLHHTRDLINLHVRDCLVENFEALIDSISLPDIDDRHVLAAGIHCRASIIVTYNLKDFPSDKLEPFGIEAWHPDEFIFYFLEADPKRVCAAIKKLRNSLKNPPVQTETYLNVLGKQSLLKTIEKLKNNYWDII